MVKKVLDEMSCLPSGNFPHHRDVVHSLEVGSMGYRCPDNDHEELHRKDESAESLNQPILDCQVVNVEEHDDGGRESKCHPVHPVQLYA